MFYIGVAVLQVRSLWCLPWWALGVKLFPGLDCSCSGSRLFHKWACICKPGCVFNCCIFGFSITSCLSIISCNWCSSSNDTHKTAVATSYCRSCTDPAIWAWHPWPLSNPVATCPGGWSSSWSSTNSRRWFVQGTQAFAYSRHLWHCLRCCFGWCCWSLPLPSRGSIDPEFAYAVQVCYWNHFLIMETYITMCMVFLQSTKMMDEFLRLAKANTARNLETCGVLSGSLVSTTWISAAQLLPSVF